MITIVNKQLKISIGLIMILYMSNSLSVFGKERHLSDFYKQGHELISENPDSAFLVLGEVYRKALSEKDTLHIVRALYDMGQISMNNMNYSESLNQFSEAMFFSEKKGIMLYQAKALNRLGKLNNIFKKNEIGNQYIHQAHGMLKQCVEQGILNPQELISSYLNLSLIEKVKKNYTEALSYIDSCFFLSNSNHPNNIDNGLILFEKASILLASGKEDESLTILYPLEQYYDSIVIANKTYSDKSAHAVLVLFNIGKALKEQGKKDQALKYFLKSLKSINDHNLYIGKQLDILDEVAKIYEEKKDHQSAYYSLRELKTLTDEHFKINSLKNSGVYNLKDSYREELEKKEKELMSQNLKLVEKEKVLFRSRAFFAVFCLMLLVVGLALRSRIQKIKFQNQQALEKQRSKEKEKLIEYKNRELTSYTLQMIERDDLLDRFSEHIKNDSTSKESKSLILARKQLNTSNWEEFNQRFVSVNNDFYDLLSEKFPELSQTDLKHCALIKLNFSGKEMANLLGISEKSVHMARYRIRKKLNLKTEINLSQFLNQVFK